jgi:signal transduction histidine kinase/CheY-like chemotaxis protein
MKFLEGGGESGRLMRALDWSRNPLGEPAAWPLQLRTLVGVMLGARQGILIVWGPQQITLYNDHYAEMLGARHPAAMGQRFQEVWYEIWDQVDPIISAAYAGESTQMDDIAFEMLRNGYPEETHFSFSYTPVRDEAGAVSGMFCACNELTQRVNAERQVLAQSTHLASLFDATPSFMAVLNGPEHRFSMTNAPYRALIGHRDPIGLTVREALPDLQGQFFFDLLDEVYRTGRAAVGSGTEIQFQRAADAPPERRFLDFIYQPLQTDAAVTGILVVGTDVTDRKIVSLQLEQDNVALARRAEETEERLRQAQKMEAVGQLTGGIAHDFNNMLQGIVLPLQVIRKRLAQQRFDNLDGYVEAGLASARRAASLTQRLLAFSRRQPLDEKVADVALSIRTVEPLLRTTCGENVDLVVDLPTGLWPVRTDTHQFESSLLNLVINARDAMPHGGSIRLGAANLALAADVLEGTDLPAGDYVEVSLADDGVGMPPEVLARVFDPFFTTKPIGQGTGLGLSMVYGYIRQSGGYVTVDSTEGAGTVVRLRLPRSPELPLTSHAQPPHPCDAARGAHRVLVAEDDDVVRLLVVDLLRDRGHVVSEAVSGGQAMTMLDQDVAYDLLLSDVGLPGPNGRQVADYARERRPGIRVLLMTGYAAEVATNASFLGPGMALIVKPFDSDALIAKVEEVMRELSATASPTFPPGDVAPAHAVP